MTVLSEGLDWRQRGACLAYDATLWFPEDGHTGRAGSKAASARAQAICHNDCQVRRTCLEYALNRDERFGVWGGYTAKEREYIQTRRQQ